MRIETYQLNESAYLVHLMDEWLMKDVIEKVTSDYSVPHYDDYVFSLIDEDALDTGKTYKLTFLT